MKKKTRGRDINTASETVATSACKEIKVATSVDTKGGRDIIQQLRHHEQKRRGRDNITLSRHQMRRLEVATPLSSRDNRSKERRSRHQSVVATSTAKEARSQHHPVVATTVTREERSRHHSEVATSAAKTRRSRHQEAVATPEARKAGRDLIKLSRHQIIEKQVATPVSCRDTRYK